MRMAASLAFLALVGCDRIEKRPQNDERPVGRYQMVDIGANGMGDHYVVVLDTQDGRITKCKSATVQMECALGTPSFP